MPDISYSIMAHPKRDDYAIELAQELRCSITFDVGEGLWDNAKRSWQEMQGSDYHFVIQDDAILCDGFQEKVQALIERYPDKAYCLYAGQNLKSLKGKFNKTIIHSRIHWGVALGLPAEHIEPFLKYGDKWNQAYGTKHCDTRLCRYCRRVGLEVVYPFPSLVDHQQIPSLNGDSIGRRAYEF